MYRIYSNISLATNPGVGSWCITITRGRENWIAQGNKFDDNITNNRAMLFAFIQGVERIISENIIFSKVEFYTNHKTLVDCLKGGWYIKWKYNGWLNFCGKEIENRDLWEKIVEYYEKYSFTIFYDKNGNNKKLKKPKIISKEIRRVSLSNASPAKKPKYC